MLSAMTTQTTRDLHRLHFSLRALGLAGLIAGTLDILDDIVFEAHFGVSALTIGQFIASGILGRSSFNGGWTTGALGFAIHFLVAFTATAVFTAAATRWPAMLRRPFLFGPLYGLVVYVVMNYVVVPLSRIPRPSHSVASVLNLLFAHLVFVGLTIALVTRWSYARQGSLVASTHEPG